MTVNDLVEITLPTADSFLKVRETLSRIGVASPSTKTLYQTCHILHKRGKYYIVHFKELFALDGKRSTLNDDDIARRNTILTLLQQWGLINVVNEALISDVAPVSTVKIVPYREKSDWTLVTKYQMGQHRR